VLRLTLLVPLLATLPVRLAAATDDGYTVWMAGGGVRGGTVYGATDDLAMHVADQPVTLHDLHATILHLMGLDHEWLTFKFQGRDFRLTDVHGRVVRELFA